MSVTTENYLKRIYSASELTDQEYVGLGDLAEAMEVTPGTITTMMKSLQRSGLVEYQPRTGVRLTEEGQRQALLVLRKHRVIELFLVKMVGLDWSEVHDEAEDLEHAMSDRLLARIDEILGHPTVDPHGDPIPDPDGSVDSISTVPLSEQLPGTRATVARVDHGDPRFLDYAKDSGLVPGTDISVLERRSESDTIVVEVAGSSTTLSLRAARKIRVTPRTS